MKYADRREITLQRLRCIPTVEDGGKTTSDPYIWAFGGVIKNDDLSWFVSPPGVESSTGSKHQPGADSRVRHAAFALLFFSALNFPHRAFVALEIFALAAPDIILFLTCVTSRTVDLLVEQMDKWNCGSAPAR